jgi:excisionase family DNA binding protein
MKTVQEYPIILTAKHIMEILGVGKDYAYELMKRKDFPTIKVGKYKRVHRDDFFAWLEKQKQAQ